MTLPNKTPRGVITMANATRKNGSVTHHAMSSRLLELSADTNLPQPYPVTEAIVVQPPTRTRRQAMHDAELRMFVNAQQLAKAMAAASEPPPAFPTEADDSLTAAPAGDDGTNEDELRQARAAARAAELAAHDAALAAWDKRTAAVNRKVESINAESRSANDDFDRAFFGTAYEAVIDYFEDKPTLWELFVPDIKAEFLPPAPHDGKCTTCGRMDEEQAGKVPESST